MDEISSEDAMRGEEKLCCLVADVAEATVHFLDWLDARSSY